MNMRSAQCNAAGSRYSDQTIKLGKYGQRFCYSFTVLTLAAHLVRASIRTHYVGKQFLEIQMSQKAE